MMEREQRLGALPLPRRRILGAMAAAPIAAVLVAHGVVGAADIATLTPPPPLTKVTGTVTSVSGSSLTVKQADGTSATVTTTGDTIAVQLRAIAVSDLKVGDLVGVAGDKTSDTAFTATNIMKLNGPKGGAALGKPVTIAKGTIGPPPDGSKNANGYFVVGTSNGTPPPLPPSADGTTHVIALGFGPDDTVAKPGVIGEITAISGTTLTVKTPDDTSVTVTTSAQTTVITDQTGSVSDIAVGDSVTAVSDKQGTPLSAISVTFRHNG